jgi:hypothetical protein
MENAPHAAQMVSIWTWFLHLRATASSVDHEIEPPQFLQEFLAFQFHCGVSSPRIARLTADFQLPMPLSGADDRLVVTAQNTARYRRKMNGTWNLRD